VRREAAVSVRPPTFDNYSVLRVLGEGGMGIVYLGHDLRADLPVAIKVMSKRLTDPVQQKRFLQENEILSELNHRNIVRCFEIVRTREGVPSIVMEYLDGVDLRSFEGRPYPELLPLLIQVVMGMKYLKSRNILHRDLSSNNILVTLDNGKRLAKILDFGVAKVLRDQPREGDIRTLTGLFLGKFSFASPELFFAKEVDWRSDIYSLGVIFHRLLTGRSPVRVERANNYYEWVMAHQRPQEIDVEALPGLPPLPESLRQIVLRMLARNPDDRPQSYDEIIDALDGLQRGVHEQGLEPDATTLAALPLPVETPPERLQEVVQGAPVGPLSSPATGTPLPTVPPAPELAIPTTERGEKAALDWLREPSSPGEAPAEPPPAGGGFGDDTEKVRVDDLVGRAVKTEKLLAALPDMVPEPGLEPPPRPQPRPAPPVPRTPVSPRPVAPPALPREPGPGDGRRRFPLLAITLTICIAALFGALLWVLIGLMG